MYFYVVTLAPGQNVPQNLLGQQCSVTFNYADGSHSTPPAVGTVNAILPNGIVMATPIINLMDSWNAFGGAVGGTLSIPPAQSIAATEQKPATYTIKGFKKKVTGMQFAMEEAATPYRVTINMSQQTVNNLNKYKFILYGFKAVQTSAAGSPLVWFQTTQYGLSTKVAWEVQYQAYTTTSQIITGGQITATNSYDISLNNTLDVTSTTGTGSIDTLTGTPLAISILNETSTQFTCGISQTQPDGTITPMCAFPLFGNNEDVIAPIEQVLLMFSTEAVNTGTVIEQSYGPGILINLTSENSQTVGYEMNGGWSWDGGPWAQQVKPNSNLVPLLIQPSASLVKRRLRAFDRGASVA